MSRTEKERAAFREMSLRDKVDHIYTYYKLPILLGLIVLAFVCSTVYRLLTEKETVLYTALLNVSVGEATEARLSDGFIAASGADPQKSEVYLYKGAYLSDDPSAENHKYGYASKLKLMAAIEAQQLDVVLMNREAYDIYAQNGYLLELPGLLSDSLYRLLEPNLITNTVILEDNAIEYTLGEANQYHAETEQAVNGIDVSSFPLFQEAGFSDAVYLGVVANSPRLPAVTQYIAYLVGTV